MEPSLLEREGVVAAVNDVSLEVARGELLIVMGLSGSGKSTLVRCLSRLIEPSAGEVEIEGADLLRMSDRELIDLRRNKMGMVFQNFALLPHRTALENIAFPLQMRGMKRRDYVERARRMIALVGLEGAGEQLPAGALRGSAAAGRESRDSLAVEPDIWFLDEPFSALDPLIRKEMQDEFLRLQSLLRKTIVFITHDFDEALKLADRMAIMFNGSVEQIGKPEDIVLDPATEYVARFTSDVPRERVLRVGSVMEPPSDDEAVAGRAVNVADRIEHVMEYVLGERLPVPVTGDDDTVVGVLHQAHVLKVLFPSRAEPA